MIKSKYHRRPIIMSQMRNMDVIAIVIGKNENETVSNII